MPNTSSAEAETCKGRKPRAIRPNREKTRARIEMAAVPRARPLRGRTPAGTPNSEGTGESRGRGTHRALRPPSSARRPWAAAGSRPRDTPRRAQQRPPRSAARAASRYVGRAARPPPGPRETWPPAHTARGGCAPQAPAPPETEPAPLRPEPSQSPHPLRWPLLQRRGRAEAQGGARKGDVEDRPDRASRPSRHAADGHGWAR